jgi:mannose-1-phosphate guanylyltransferase
VQRSVLDLPVTARMRVMDLWQNEVAELAHSLGAESLPLRLLLNDRAPEPTEPTDHPSVPTSVEFDSGEYRGTGGALRDVAVAYDADDWLLLASGGQVLVQPLARIVASLSAGSGPVRLVTHADGTPSGLMLVRCGVLWPISEVGFVDFKEQALPRIAKDHRVEVSEQPQPVGIPARTRAEYLKGLYRYHAPQLQQSAQADPFMETWRPTFSVIEQGAEVAPEARIHDAVVLAGARVEAGAVVTRSIVAESGRVRRGAHCVERIAFEGPEGDTR